MNLKCSAKKQTTNMFSVLLRAWLVFGCFVTLVPLASCGAEVVRAMDAQVTDRGSVTRTPAQAFWSPAIRRVVFEVHYTADAVPYVNTVPGVGSPWAILRANAERLLRGSNKSIVVPTTLGQMHRENFSGNNFTNESLAALTRTWREAPVAGDTVTFRILVLAGQFTDPSGRVRSDLLGGHIDDSSVIVVFKPVVASTAAGAEAWVPSVVEQATIVHELGHAVGMVDNGVAPIRPHADGRFIHHCTNTRCVMNAYNEGASSARAFVARFASTNDPILFDADCLLDATSALASAR
jgi:hypothetical protein